MPRAGWCSPSRTCARSVTSWSWNSRPERRTMAQGTGPFVRVPSVLVRHGRPVTVVEGHYEDATDELGAPLTAVDVVGHLLRHYGQALVVDLAGIEGGPP